jgi:hypothetical protein
MRSFALLALVLVAGVGIHHGMAAAAQISIDPPSPSSGDSVKVTVKNSFSMGCWTVLSTNCTPLVGDSLYVIVDVNYCNGAPSCVCTLFPVDYTRVCNFGLLPVGSYVAAFFENHVNPADPLSSFVIAQPFTVTGPTAALRRTWAAVKSYYH